MLLNVLDEFLGSRVKVAILRLLCARRRQFTGREVAREVHRAPATTHEALQALVASGVVEQEARAPVMLYRISERNPWVNDVLRPLFAAEERAEEALLREVGEGGTKASESIVVFGSRAKGTSRPGSDLDLLFVVRSRSDIDRVTAAMGALSVRWGLSIEPLCVALRELRDWASRSPDVWADILSHGVALHGLTPAELARHVTDRPVAVG
jgi:predicted nucleotidyltransferase